MIWMIKKRMKATLRTKISESKNLTREVDLKTI